MSNTTESGGAPVDSRQGQLLREAADWRLLGLLFECPSANWRHQVEGLAAETADAELRAAAQQALQDAAEPLYHSVFGPGGPAPAREASCRESLQLGYLMSELNAFYEAFAYRPATLEAPDHVSVQIGFVGYLKLKEAFALASSDGGHAAITAEAAGRFIGEHLSVLAEPLAAALRNSGVHHLELAGAVLLRRVGPRPQAEK
jgi:hypothetical protein